MKRRWYLTLSVFILAQLWAATPPTVMSGREYRGGVDVNAYFVSEKLDGVRARFDGEKLISRNGTVFAAPSWFIATLPPQTLDGELWIRRGAYQETVSVVMQAQPHEGWRAVKLMVFDLPEHGGNFAQRVTAMAEMAAKATGTEHYWQMIPQERMADNSALMKRLQTVVAEGGEGLMLHHAQALYRSGRSDQLLKLKEKSDDEARVIGYRPGKGKYQGMVGALQVRHHSGLVFFIGSGLSDQDRKKPPAIGSLISYQYSGFTARGIPRFAVFWRRACENCGAPNP